MPVIKLKDEVYQRLRDLKVRLGHSSFNETVSYLLDKATDPKTFLESLTFFLEDVRSDVKRLVMQLENLNAYLRKLTQ